MKKDITNVIITFGLVGLMLYGGSYFYTKKILAEDEAWNIESTNEENSLSEESKIQEEILAKQAEDARLLAEKVTTSTEAVEEEVILIDTNPPKSVAAKPTTNTTFANDIAKKQAEFEAAQQAILEAQQAELRKKQAAADLLAQQLADQKAADARAQQLADQKAAADKAAAQKKSRRSRAS